MVLERERARLERELVLLRDRRVLEVGCGAGEWTAKLAPLAALLVAVDSAERLGARPSLPTHVSFLARDPRAIGELRGAFDGGASLFWLSALAPEEAAQWLAAFSARLARGSPVLLADLRSPAWELSALRARLEPCGERLRIELGRRLWFAAYRTR